MTYDKQVIFCDCHSPEHQLIVLGDEDFVYLHIHLDKRSFWKRLVAGVKYIFGYYCQYGHWDEILLNKEAADRFGNLLVNYAGLPKDPGTWISVSKQDDTVATKPPEPKVIPDNTLYVWGPPCYGPRPFIFDSSNKGV